MRRIAAMPWHQITPATGKPKNKNNINMLQWYERRAYSPGSGAILGEAVPVNKTALGVCNSAGWRGLGPTGTPSLVPCIWSFY